MRCLVLLLLAVLFISSATRAEAGAKKGYVASAAVACGTMLLLVLNDPEISPLQEEKAGATSRRDGEISRLAVKKGAYHYGYGVYWKASGKDFLKVLTSEEIQVMANVKEDPDAAIDLLTHLFKVPPSASAKDKGLIRFLDPVPLTELITRGVHTDEKIEGNGFHQSIAMTAVLNAFGLRCQIVCGEYKVANKTRTRVFIYLTVQGSWVDLEEGVVRSGDQHHRYYPEFRPQHAAELGIEAPNFY